MRLMFFVSAAACALAATGFAGEPEIPAVQARVGEHFIELLGVNVRLAADKSSYATNPQVIKPRLLELGVRYVRDACTMDRQDQIAKLKDLAKSGIRCSLIVKPVEAVSLCKILGSVVSIEGPDEPDRGGEGWPDVARANQRVLFKSMKSDPATQQIMVMGPGMRNPKTSYEKLGSLADCIDWGSFHYFPGGSNPNFQALHALALEGEHTSGVKGQAVTEAGYHNKVDDPDSPGVPEPIAAKYLPRQLLFFFIYTYPRTFIYELMDSQADPRMTTPEKHFGLLRADGTPKPAFTALKKLIEVLRDPGPTFQPGSLAYKILGTHKNIQHVLFQKRDGTFYLLIWNEVPSYDYRGRQDIAVAAQEVTIDIGTPLAQASARYPLRDNDRPRPAADLKKLRVPVNDEILLIEMKRK